MTIKELKRNLDRLITKGYGDVEVTTADSNSLFAVEEVWIDEDTGYAVVGGGGYLTTYNKEEE